MARSMRIDTKTYIKIHQHLSATGQHDLANEMYQTSDPILCSMVWTDEDAAQVANEAIESGQMAKEQYTDFIREAGENFESPAANEAASDSLQWFLNDYLEKNGN